MKVPKAEQWYRNEEWNAETAAEYFAKLKRARSKDQYLAIQALYLVARHPDISLMLLERFFALNHPFGMARAWCTKAEALLQLDRVTEAILAYEGALAEEVKMPSQLTDAWLDVALLIASRRVIEHYGRALELLTDTTRRVVFPVQSFKRLAAAALIESETGDRARAGRLAAEALAVAQVENSGISRHPTLGLVGFRYADVLARLKNM